MNPNEVFRPPIIPPPPSAAPSVNGNSNNLARWAAPAALALGTGYALHRAGKVQNEQEARMTDISNSRQHDMTATLPSMAVKNAHDEFCQRKLASANSPHFGGPTYSPVSPRVYDAGTNELARVLADVGVKQPLNSLIGIVKKKLYTEPKQRRVFDEVIKSDPDLERTLKEQPHIINDTYDTLKFVGPNLSTNRNAVRNFLRNGVAVGGNIDYSTIKTLAETEKTLRQARGEIGGF